MPLWSYFVVLALFTAGCALMVWHQFRCTAATRREPERVHAELEAKLTEFEAKAAELLERFDDCGVEN